MQRKLFKIIDALDNKYDIEIEQYFKLSEVDRDELAQIISNNLITTSNNIPVVIHSYLTSIHALINQLTEHEEYEKCDLFYRIEKKLFDAIQNIV